MTCPVCGPAPSAKAKKKRTCQAREAATWSSVAAAVALITNERTRAGASVAELLGDSSPEQVIRAQAIVMGVMLDVLAPEHATRVLRHLGLYALEEGVRRS
jgi:hypothetical protein